MALVVERVRRSREGGGLLCRHGIGVGVMRRAAAVCLPSGLDGVVVGVGLAAAVVRVEVGVGFNRFSPINATCAAMA